MGQYLQRPEVRRSIERPVPVATAPTFATGWSNVGAGYSNAGYYLDRGRVYLSGAVANGGTGTGTIFTLPSGFRPAGTVQFIVPIFGGTGLVSISTAGVVTDLTFSAASKAATVLSPISFRVANG